MQCKRLRRGNQAYLDIALISLVMQVTMRIRENRRQGCFANAGTAA